MVNCIFYTIFFTLFLNVSVGSLRFSQVNRSFISIYKGVFEASVYTVDVSGEPIQPYYNKDLLRSYVTSYFDENIKKYSSDYELNFIFYKGNTAKIAMASELSQKVKIKLHAKINYLYNFDKEQYYSIKTKETL